VVKNIKGLPDSSWVSHIEASPHDPAVAFITCDNHRRGDWTTWVFKTDNFGRTWKSLATSQVRGFAHVVIQDPVEPALLFLGTEFGLWFSRDGGGNWTQWTHGFPTVPVRDLTIQKREGDLVIGTHGRAAYILDDIRPLRGLDAAVMKETVHLFPVPDAYSVTIGQVGGFHFPGHAMFAGENRPYGALISYWFLPPEKKGEEGAAAGSDKVVLTILDAAGDTVRTMDGTMEKGINRVVWDLNRNALDPEVSIFGPGTGPEVLPGTYTVILSCGTASSQQPVIMHGDPRRPIPMADRQAKEAAFLRLEAMLGVMNKAVQGLGKMDGETGTLLQRLGEAEKEKPGDEALKSLRTGLDAFRKEIAELRKRFIGDQDAQGIYRPSDTIQNVVFAPLGSMGSTWDAPTPDERILMERAERALAEGLESYNALVRDTLPALRRQAQAAGLQWTQGIEPLSLPARVPPR
jgi:hypothetical protein